MKSVHDGFETFEIVFQRDLMVHEVSRLLLQHPDLMEACRERMRMIDVLVTESAAQSGAQFAGHH